MKINDKTATVSLAPNWSLMPQETLETSAKPNPGEWELLLLSSSARAALTSGWERSTHAFLHHASSINISQEEEQRLRLARGGDEKKETRAKHCYLCAQVNF